MAWVSRAHHVLRVKHLLGELGNCECTVLLGSTRRQRSEACHEEVQAREWNEVHGDFTKIAVQLAREAEAAGHATHRCADEMIQITVCWCGELLGAEADVVQGFIVEEEALIGILDKLVERKHCVVWLNDCVRDFRRRNHQGKL